MTIPSIIPYEPRWDPAIEILLHEVMGPGRFARTAERLREGNQAIPEYGFLLVDEKEALLGAISFWPIAIGETSALLLGPLAVLPAYRGQGSGLALITTARDKIMSREPRAILLVGDEPYYSRVGFRGAPAEVTLPGPVDPKRVLIWVPEGDDLPCGPVQAARA